MKVELSPQAAKYLERLNQPQKGRIIKALMKLKLEPPEGDIKALSGKDGFRMRVGGYRILFDVLDKAIVVYAIAPRGEAYKGGK